MKRIVIIVGSLSDLPQCKRGLECLQKAQDEGYVDVDVYIASIHRNTERLQFLLKSFISSGNIPDVIIAGAGWANHLTGCVDAFLRYTIKDSSIPVIGVGFRDDKSERNSQAAYLSMACVPGTQAILHNGDDVPFLGKIGFFDACEYALKGKFPKIALPKGKEFKKLTLKEALS